MAEKEDSKAGINELGISLKQELARELEASVLMKVYGSVLERNEGTLGGYKLTRQKAGKSRDHYWLRYGDKVDGYVMAELNSYYRQGGELYYVESDLEKYWIDQKNGDKYRIDQKIGDKYWIDPKSGDKYRIDSKTGMKYYEEPKTGMRLARVQGGCYQMGSKAGESDEEPVHEVCVKGFDIGQYEITQGQWQKIMGSNPSRFKACGNDCPVERVSWEDIQDYIKKLNAGSPYRYRLPTEAEWEYACRSGGKDQKYCGGNDLNGLGWYDDNSGRKSHAVGQKQANGMELYDMSGNVWEWVSDWYGYDYYGDSTRDNPKGSSSGSRRVSRGGSWGNLANGCRSADRNNNSPDSRYSYLGFRLARTKKLTFGFFTFLPFG